MKPVPSCEKIGVPLIAAAWTSPVLVPGIGTGALHVAPSSPDA